MIESQRNATIPAAHRRGTSCVYFVSDKWRQKRKQAEARATPKAKVTESIHSWNKEIKMPGGRRGREAKKDRDTPRLADIFSLQFVYSRNISITSHPSRTKYIQARVLTAGHLLQWGKALNSELRLWMYVCVCVRERERARARARERDWETNSRPRENAFRIFPSSYKT